MPQQIAAAAAGAGLAPEDYTIRVTTHAGHALSLIHISLKGYDEELKDEKPSEMNWATPGGSWAEGETAGLQDVYKRQWQEIRA